MSKNEIHDAMTVTFSGDFSALPVSSEEVQLVCGHIGDLLLKVLMAEGD